MTRIVELTLAECTVILENLTADFRDECDDMFEKYEYGADFEFDDAQFERVVAKVALIQKIRRVHDKLQHFQEQLEPPLPCRD